MSKRHKLKKTLVDQILDKANITHDSLSLNALEGDLPEHIQKEDIYKTLALSGDKTGPIIGIVPITEHLSEKKLAKVSGNKKVTMIPQKDLQKTTGYIHGANNPVGIRQRHAFPIYIDNQALQKDYIIVSAGEIGRSIGIKASLLADFVQAEFADLQDN
ncbi:aminoacyl-tRNA deacylase [Streptococcus sp. zg-JUN1979]|uniref:aminoacyl-tRNA deacylase n=1 Tax=Streptococcus sp. zg-JUN1979 TaxID=3391450 RepID=UPI0039A642F6